MPAPETTKQHVIESLLDNEALTDGLTDADARVVIQWMLDQVERFTPTAEQSLDAYGHHLARQARTISRIAAQIQDEDDPDRIARRLQRLTGNTDLQVTFLRLLKEQRPLQDYLRALCRIAEGH